MAGSIFIWRLPWTQQSNDVVLCSQANADSSSVSFDHLYAKLLVWAHDTNSTPSAKGRSSIRQPSPMLHMFVCEKFFNDTLLCSCGAIGLTSS